MRSDLRLRRTENRRYVTPHIRRAGRLVTDEKVLRPHEAKDDATSSTSGRADRLAGRAASRPVAWVGRKTGKAAAVKGRRAGRRVVAGRARGSRRLVGLLAQAIAQTVAGRPIRTRSRVPRGYEAKLGRRRPRLGRPDRRGRAGRQTETGSHPVSSRQNARGSRRAGQAAARMAAQAVARIVAAVLAPAGTAVGMTFAVIAAILLAVMIVLSFIPSWIVNFFYEDEAQTAGLAMTNDYPWAGQVRDGAGKATSAYNTVNPSTRYYYGNCTDFVYWRVNRDMGGGPGRWVYTHGDLTPRGGDGRQWGKPGNLPGWTTVSDPSEAQMGDVVSFEAGVHGHTSVHGHVAYVASVSEDGAITTENYGAAQYYVETIPADVAKKAIKNGGIVIKRNPKLAEAGGPGRVSQPPASGVEAGANVSGVVSTARQYIGTPYRGVRGGMDCCVFVKTVFGRHGVNLPMSVKGNPWATSKCEYAMYSLASRYGGHYVNATTSELAPGDIVFFQSMSVPASKDNVTHVGIYVGDGKIIDSIPSGGVGVRPLSFYRHSDALLPRAVRVGGK